MPDRLREEPPSTGEERVYYIDLSEAETPADFQARVREALPVPAHYGGNLDALYDALTEFGAGWNLILYRYAALERAQPKYFAALRRLLAEASEAAPGLRARFFKG